jgi:hypothetical protein
MLANLKRAALGLLAVLAVLGLGLAPAQAQGLQTPAGIALLSGGNACAGVTLGLNFVANKYCSASGKSGSISAIPGWSFTRASDGWAKDSLGNDIQFGSGVPRITDLGLLIEESRTNFLLNSTAPVTQTTGSLGTGTYTLWVVGSGSAAITAGTGTATGLGTATAASPVTITVTVAGTFTVTNTGSVTFFQLENGAFATSRIVTTGSTATRAADVALVGGLSAASAAKFPGQLSVQVLTTHPTSGATAVEWAAQLNDGSLNNRIGTFRPPGSSDVGFRYIAAGVATNPGNAVTAWAANSTHTAVLLWSSTKTSGVADAVAGTDAAAAAGLPAITQLSIGADNNGGNQFNGYVQRVVSGQ